MNYKELDEYIAEYGNDNETGIRTIEQEGKQCHT